MSEKKFFSTFGKGAASSLPGALGVAYQNAQIADTSGLESEMLDSISSQPYETDNDSLMANYNAYNPYNTHLTGKDVRGSNPYEQIFNVTGSALGSVLSSDLSKSPAGAIGGIFTNAALGGAGIAIGNARANNKAEHLNRLAMDANSEFLRSFNNNASNVKDRTFRNATLNLAAYGGNLSTFTKSRLMSKSFKMKPRKLKYGGYGKFFAYGGELSGDWSNGVTLIKEGGTHETNPYEGVLFGMDEQGIPNLVEEGEVIFNDYVFSNRLKPTDKQLKDVKLSSKYKGKSYAEIAEIIQEESSNRPLDPISKNTLVDSMSKLQALQDETKQKKEERRLLREFKSLPLEEQAAVVSQGLSQENPEMMQQEQPVEENTSEPRAYSSIREAMGEELIGQPYSYGGLIRKFDEGTPSDVEISQEDKNNAKQEELLSQAYINKIKQKYETSTRKQQRDLLNKYRYIIENWQQGYYFTPLADKINQINIANTDPATYGYDNTVNVKDIENSEDYKRFTDYILNKGTLDEGGLNYLKVLQEKLNTDSNRVNLFSNYENGTLADNWKDIYRNLRNDGKFSIFHLTPEWREFNHYLVGKDGNRGILQNDELNNYELYDRDAEGNWLYREIQTPETPPQNTNITKPGTITSGSETSDDKDKQSTTTDIPELNALQFAPVLGSAIGAIGGLFQEPNYENADLIARGRRGIRDVRARAIGNYLPYNPMDINYEQNRLAQIGAGTQRAILNSSANRGQAIASLLPMYGNEVGQMGDLYRKAAEYNDNQRKVVADFNRGTDLQNAQFGMSADSTNANLDTQRATLYTQEATLRDNIESALSKSKSENLSNFFTNLGEVGNTRYSGDQQNFVISRGVIPGVKNKNGGLLRRNKKRNKK